MRITWGTYFFCLIKCKLWGINLALDLKSLEKRGVLVGGRRDGVEHEPEESKLDNYLVTLQSVQSLSHVQLFVTPWTAARQTSLSITNSWSLLKVMFIELVIPSHHLILCQPLFLLPSIFPSIRIFSNESFFTSGGQIIGDSASASASVLLMNIQDWFPLGWTGWISLQSKGLSGVFSNTTVQKHRFFGAQLSL